MTAVEETKGSSGTGRVLKETSDVLQLQEPEYQEATNSTFVANAFLLPSPEPAPSGPKEEPCNAVHLLPIISKR